MGLQQLDDLLLLRHAPLQFLEVEVVVEASDVLGYILAIVYFLAIWVVWDVLLEQSIRK